MCYIKLSHYIHSGFRFYTFIAYNLQNPEMASIPTSATCAVKWSILAWNDSFSVDKLPTSWVWDEFSSVNMSLKLTLYLFQNSKYFTETLTLYFVRKTSSFLTRFAEVHVVWPELFWVLAHIFLLLSQCPAALLTSPQVLPLL